MAELRDVLEGDRDPAGADSRGAVDPQQEPVDAVFPNLSHWIACFCVVTFDLELGQALEVR